MQQGWERNVRRVVPYVPGEQPKAEGLIKLNTNENPYPPAPGVARALRQMDAESFRRYPDPEASLLVKAIADRCGVGENQVFVGVGSDDVLALSFLTFFNSRLPVLFPDVTYSFYKVWAELFRIPYETPALAEDFSLQPQDYFRPNGGIVFPNPNAPTGLFLPPDQAEEIVRRNPGSVVIIDEAYIDFGGVSALPLIDRYENLLVVQTFSKSRSMAGIRIGFAVGSPKLIAALKDVKFSYNSYTMNLPSILLGAAALADEAYFQETAAKITATREEAKTRLRELGFSFPDSMTNFIFARHDRTPAREIFEALKRERIYVRYFPQPRLDDYLRITVGTPQEMEALYACLKRVI